MKTIRFPLATLILIGLLNAALFADDLIDQIDDHLTINAFHGAVRARLSGLLDLEAYRIEQPPPGRAAMTSNTVAAIVDMGRFYAAG